MSSSVPTSPKSSNRGKAKLKGKDQLQKIEGRRVLTLCYEGKRFYIPPVELDEYFLLDLHRDAKEVLLHAGCEPPEYFGFLYGVPGGQSKRKLPLTCDDDWVKLVRLWDYEKGDIPIYLLPTNSPSKYNILANQLDAQSREKPQVLRIPNEIAPSLSDTDSESDGLEVVGVNEYEASVADRNAKRWADSLICTPHSQLTGPSCTPPHPKKLTSPSSSPQPKKVILRSASAPPQPNKPRTRSSFSFESKQHSIPSPSPQPKRTTRSSSSLEPKKANALSPSHQPRKPITRASSALEPKQPTAPPSSSIPKKATASPSSSQPKKATVPLSSSQPKKQLTAPPSSSKPKKPTAPPSSSQSKKATVPPSSCQPKKASGPSPSSQTRRPTTRASSSQPKSDDIPHLDDIDIGLRGLEAYDLRSLSQQPRDNDYIGDCDDDSDACSTEDEAECDEIPDQVDNCDVDEDGNPYCNMWNRLYQNGKRWCRSANGSISIQVGDLFIDKDHWSKVIREYAIQEGFCLQRYKNERRRHIAVCKQDTCSWRVHASRLGDGVTWQVKSLQGEHRCTKLQHNRMASHPWVASELLSAFKENPQMSYDNMKFTMMDKYGLDIPTHTCQRAKRLLREWVEGNHGESYARLPDYIEVIKKRNPGTIASCISEGPQNARIFKRLFISFGAMMTGFQRGCRPFIGVDGCFLKGPYKGVLLTAMGLDANNGFFPLAYGVVAREDFSNWAYFFRALRLCLDGVDASKLTFISDRHKGLLKAMHEIFPESNRRICDVHYYRNFSSYFPGPKLHLLFWTACNAYTKHVHNQAMESIKKESNEAFQWLLDEPVEHWARFTFDEESKCPDNTTNFVESFNGKIVRYRYKPIFVLLEAVRRKFMRTIANRAAVAKKWSDRVVPRVKMILVDTEKQSRSCRLTPAGKGIFEVLDGSTQFTVDLNMRYCDCKVWSISGIPCKHAARCILSERGELQSYVDEALTVEKYIQTYDVCMNPIADPIFWDETDCPKLFPPLIEIKRGRPVTERRRDITEKRKRFSRSTTLRCSQCNEFGHNKRSHRDNGVLQILKGTDKPSYKRKRGGKLGRPRKEEAPTKKAKKGKAKQQSSSTPAE